MAKKKSRRERLRQAPTRTNEREHTREETVVSGMEYQYPIQRIRRDLLTSVGLFMVLMAVILGLSRVLPH